MTGPDPSDLLVREPSPAEIGRALHLFRTDPLPRQARLFVAVKMLPLERFVAAAAWWPMADALVFRLAVQPGSAARLAAADRLVRQIAESGRALGVRTMRYAALLPDNSEWVPVLKENAFAVLHSERFFEVSAVKASARMKALAERMRDKFPSTWRTDSIRHHRPETILNLIEPYQLMPAEEVRDRWRDDCPYGFELDWSAILFDGSRPVGAFLTRWKLDTLCVDVRVVQTGDLLLNSLGNMALFCHGADQAGSAKPVINRLQFRGGEIEHLETANLARRMGGNELPPRHTFARSL